MSRRNRRNSRHFRGAVATEYAVVLALVTVITVGGALLLATGVRSTFENASLSGRMGMSAGATADAAKQQADDDPGDRPSSQMAVVVSIVAIAAAVSGLLLFRKYTADASVETEDKEDELPRMLVRKVTENVLFKKRQEIYRTLAVDTKAIFTSKLLVGHVMSHNVTTVRANEPAATVNARMDRDRLRHLLVVDGEQRLVGIISDRDLSKRNATTATEMMTPDPFTVKTDTDINPAITLMIDKRISSLPVVGDDGEIVGVVTTTDLMMGFQCALKLLTEIGRCTQEESGGGNLLEKSETGSGNS